MSIACPGCIARGIPFEKCCMARYSGPSLQVINPSGVGGLQMVVLRGTCENCGAYVEMQQAACLRDDGVWELTKVAQ